MCPNGSEYTEIYVLCLSRSFENWSVYDPNWKKPSKLFELYVDVGTTCNAVLGVICPVFLVAALNILLIKLLHKSKMKVRIIVLYCCHIVLQIHNGFAVFRGFYHSEKEKGKNLKIKEIFATCNITIE